MSKSKDRIEFPAQMALAKQIAADLFTGHNGKALRLGLVTCESPLRLGGGWCEDAIVTRIYKHLVGDLPKGGDA